MDKKALGQVCWVPDIEINTKIILSKWYNIRKWLQQKRQNFWKRYFCSNYKTLFLSTLNAFVKTFYSYFLIIFQNFPALFQL